MAVKSGANNLNPTATSLGNMTTAAGADTLKSTSNINITGGTLLLSGSGNRVNNSAGVQISANSVSVPALTLSGTVTEILGGLTINSAGSSVIDLGAGAAVVTFADSSLNAWVGLLAIWNWSGSLSGGGTDQLQFTNATGLTSAQLLNISFVDPSGLPAGTYGGQLLGTGELAPVPEPGGALVGIGLLSLVLSRELRRKVRRPRFPTFPPALP